MTIATAPSLDPKRVPSTHSAIARSAGQHTKKADSQTFLSSAFRQTRVVAKDLGVLLLLAILLPINLLITSFALVTTIVYRIGSKRSSSRSKPETAKPGTAKKGTVLVSGGKMTKALQLARLFDLAGYRVVLCETKNYWMSGHQFSFAVDRFVKTDKPDDPSYVDDLRRIIDQEGVDFYVPVCSPVASFHDAQVREALGAHVTTIHPNVKQIELLDNKYRLARAARAIGLGAPESFLITDPQQVLDFDFKGRERSYILKSIPYDSVLRLDLTPLPMESLAATEAFLSCLPISEDHPWVMQEFIPGKEYCTHGTARNGELRVFCCCESSAFQVNYQHIDDPEIEAWVRRFVKHYELTGQVSFDFIRAADNGQLVAIECNPRTHSAITTFHDSELLADAYLCDNKLSHPLRPKENSRPTYWLYHELWRMLVKVHRPRKLLERFRVVWNGSEAIFDWHDPLPFLMVYHFQIPLLLLKDIYKRRGWVRIDFNIGKLVQLGGD